MITHNVQQGSKEWLALRANHFTASEAPVMMGDSKHMSRDKLLHLKKTGISEEVSPTLQRIFDQGHASEAAARPIAESISGAELYPATGTIDIDGLALLASFDGITMLGDVVWENKLFNEGLADCVRAGELDPHYYWQLEQQLLVSGAARAYFTTSDGTAENTHGMYYLSVPERRQALIAGWKQFKTDLETYVHQPEEVKPVADAIMELPALNIQIKGEVKDSNLALYEGQAMAFIQAINTDLQTDEDFANAEQTVKFCDKAEKQLEVVKQAAIAQTVDIDTLFRSIDRLKEEMKAKRLMLNKLVNSRKEAVKVEIMNAARVELAEHIRIVIDGLGGDYLPNIKSDFPGAMKNKRTITSLREAVNDEMARVKIEASAVAEKIRRNLSSLRELAADYKFLFGDIKDIITKDNDDMVLLINARVGVHKQAEEAKAEAERERIRQEEAARLEAAHAAEQAEAVRLAREEEQRIAAEQKAVADEEARRIAAEQDARIEAAQPAPQQEQPKPSAPARSQTNEPATLKLCDIRDRLGFALSAEFITETLGISPAEKQRSAVTYRESDFEHICSALIDHIGNEVNGNRQQIK